MLTILEKEAVPFCITAILERQPCPEPDDLWLQEAPAPPPARG